MVKTLREEPKFSEMFTAYLLARTVRVEEDLVDQLSIAARSAWRVPAYFG